MSVYLLENFLLVIPQQDILSDFENSSRWNNINDGFRSTSLDPTIFLDNFCILKDKYNTIAEGLYQGIVSGLSDGSFSENHKLAHQELLML